MSRTIFPVTKDVAKMMQPIMGCKPDEKDVDVLTAAGGPSDPKKGVVPEAGSLEFNTEGGVPYPDTPAPDGDGGVGDGGVGVGVGVVVVAVVGVGVGVGFAVAIADDAKMQEPMLGLALTIVAVPPKSQLVGAGFF